MMHQRAMAQALDGSSVTGGTTLPSDAVYEILLRLPERTLCRFRVVCRSWRSLTTDPLFIQTYETYHRPEPLLVVANDGGDVHTVDLAGNVVKKLCNTHVTRATAPCPHFGPMCLVRTRTTVGILDLAAGTVYASLPADGFGHTKARRGGSAYRASYALGRAATSGEHKVLRILHPITMDSRQEQRCDVFTLDGSWRQRRSPLVNVRPSFPIHDVVIDGVAYFLSDHIADAHEPDSISWFDLETEEWGSVMLRGPLSSHGLLDNADDNEEYVDGYIGLRCELGLAKVNGWLVTIRTQWRNDSSVDLWFLRDIHKGIWVKKFKIQKLWPMVPRPLMLLDDGRIVFSVELVSATHHTLQIGDSSTPNVLVVRTYDPKTDESRDAARMQGKEIVGVYAGGGSLLRPRNI
ncbi:unnamed protein product [Alopecurus aequalis]